MANILVISKNDNILKENIVGKAWIRMNTLQFISHLDGFEEQKEQKKQEASSSQG